MKSSINNQNIYGHSKYSINVGGSPMDAHYRYQRPVCMIVSRGNKTVWRNIERIAKELERDPEDLEWYISSTRKIGCFMEFGQLIIQKKWTQHVLEEVVQDFTKSFVLCQECGNPETRLKSLKESCVMCCRSCGATTHLNKTLNTQNMKFAVAQMKSSKSCAQVMAEFFERHPTASDQQVLEFIKEFKMDYMLQDTDLIHGLFESVVQKSSCKKDVMMCAPILKALSSGSPARFQLLKEIYKKANLLLFQKLSLYLMKKDILHQKNFEDFVELAKIQGCESFIQYLQEQ